jgi:hypothetical protein
MLCSWPHEYRGTLRSYSKSVASKDCPLHRRRVVHDDAVTFQDPRLPLCGPGGMSLWKARFFVEKTFLRTKRTVHSCGSRIVRRMKYSRRIQGCLQTPLQPKESTSRTLFLFRSVISLAATFWPQSLAAYHDLGGLQISTNFSRIKCCQELQPLATHVWDTCLRRNVHFVLCHLDRQG